MHKDLLHKQKIFNKIKWNEAMKMYERKAESLKFYNEIFVVLHFGFYYIPIKKIWTLTVLVLYLKANQWNT